MDAIVPGVQINRDSLCLALKAHTVPVDHGVGECDPQPEQNQPITRVLEARERRLQSEILATERVAITEEFLDRVGSQSARFIVSRIAEGNRIQTLAHQIADRMADLAR